MQATQPFPKSTAQVGKAGLAAALALAAALVGGVIATQLPWSFGAASTIAQPVAGPSLVEFRAGERLPLFDRQVVTPSQVEFRAGERQPLFGDQSTGGQPSGIAPHSGLRGRIAN